MREMGIEEKEGTAYGKPLDEEIRGRNWGQN